MKAANILETIGNTPHVRINRLFGDRAEVWIKQERANPGGSIKDRIALSMVEDAERSGKLKPGGAIVEPTSRQYRHRPGDGRRGQGLSADPGHARQHERRAPPADARLRRRVRAHAAREGHEGRDRPGRGNDRRRRPNSWMPQQFENPANLEVHRRTTAQEILRDFADQPLDALITGVGTGGHITGCAEVLKKEWPNLKVFAVEPTLSPVLSGGEPGPHPIQGIGAGFIPEHHDTAIARRHHPGRRRTMPRKWRGARRARKACWSAFRRARRSPRSRRSCPNWAKSRACWASTTTPASAICRSPDFLPEEAELSRSKTSSI